MKHTRLPLSYAETRVSISVPPLPARRPQETLFARVVAGHPISPHDMYLVLSSMRYNSHRYGPRSAAKVAIESDVIRWSRAHSWHYGIQDDGSALETCSHPFVLYADTPAGQLSFHITRDRAAGLPSYDGRWDGQRGETWKRLRALYGARLLSLRELISFYSPTDDEPARRGGWIVSSQNGVGSVEHAYSRARDLIWYLYTRPVLAHAAYHRVGDWIDEELMIMPDEAGYDYVRRQQQKGEKK